VGKTACLPLLKQPTAVGVGLYQLSRKGQWECRIYLATSDNRNITVGDLERTVEGRRYTIIYPKVFGLAAWSENYK